LFFGGEKVVTAVGQQREKRNVRKVLHSMSAETDEGFN